MKNFKNFLTENKLQSAGVLLYTDDSVFIVHPFMGRKWDIPKGGVEKGEDLLTAAIREFEEETGVKLYAKKDEYIDLGSVKSKYKTNQKTVYIFGLKTDGTEKWIRSNLIDKGSSKGMPEVDKGIWIKRDKAKSMIWPYMSNIIDNLEKVI